MNTNVFKPSTAQDLATAKDLLMKQFNRSSDEIPNEFGTFRDKRQPFQLLNGNRLKLVMSKIISDLKVDFTIPIQRLIRLFSVRDMS